MLSLINKRPNDLQRPLCVDLDGTLVAEETHRVLARALFRHNKRRWLEALVLFVCRGRLAFKHAVARQELAQVLRVMPRSFLVTWLHSEKAKGRQLILVTGAPRCVAEHVSETPFVTGLFDRVIASDVRTNCVGKMKARALAQQFGAKRFDYVGNSWQDCPVWQAARRAYAVTDNPRLVRWLQRNLPGAAINAAGAFDLSDVRAYKNWV